MSKKSSTQTTGMEAKKEDLEEPPILKVNATRKTVARKTRLKAKMSRPIDSEVKIVSPKSVAKKKQAQAKENGMSKVKRPAPKPMKIKKQLTKQEKIAFANQVAKTQLAKGSPGFVEEPTYVPLEPPPVELLPVKMVGKKKGGNGRGKLKKAVSLKKTGGKKTAPKKKAAAPSGSVQTDDATEMLQIVPIAQTNATVRKRKSPAERLLRRKINQLVLAQNNAEMLQSAPTAETQVPSKGVVRKRGPPKRRLGTESQIESEPAHNASVATMTLRELPACVPEGTDITPTPVKRRRGRPCKKLVDSSSEPVAPPKRGRELSDDLKQTNDALNLTIQEEAKKIEENLQRPESKVSDTFSWAVDISSSSYSTINAADNKTPIDGKQATVELIDFMKYPNLSAKSSLTSQSASVTMASPKKRKASPPPRMVTTSKKMKRTTKERSVAGKENTGSTKRIHNRLKAELPSSRKHRSSDKKTDRRIETEDLQRLEKEKRLIEEQIRELDSKLGNNPFYGATQKKSDKTAKPASSITSATTSSSGNKYDRRSRSSSNHSLSSDKGIPKGTRKLAKERPPTPQVPSPSPSLNPTSSTSISMSDTVSDATRGSVPVNKMAVVLKTLRDALSNIDMEFLQMLTKDGDSDADKPIPDTTFKVLKLEVDTIKLCQKFKRTIAELSSSEKSEDKSTQSSVDTQPSCLDPEDKTVQETVPEPADTPEAPFEDKVPQEEFVDDDEEDILSLYAESISGFESMRNSILPLSRKPSPFQELSELTPPMVPMAAPIETPPVVKSKTAYIRRQNADSSTYFESTNNDAKKPLQMQTDIEKQILDKKPPLMGDIYTIPLPTKSRVFKGYCFYNLNSKCKKADCPFPHSAPNQIEIKNRLTPLSERTFIEEYLLLRRHPHLRKDFMVFYVDECQKRDLTRFLVEMASDGKREEPTTKTYIMETTLLHLNDKSLDTCKDMIINQADGAPLCDVFIKTIAETQNFSRFKSVFINLTKFLVREKRPIPLSSASQIFERICILPYEGCLAQAAISLIKNTEVAIFENRLMNKFLDRLAAKNPSAYDDLVKHRWEVTQEKAYGENPLAVQLNVENKRYTSPDTTNLEGLQNRTSEETPPIARSLPSMPLGSDFPKPMFVRPPPMMHPPRGPWHRDRSPYRGYQNGGYPQMRWPSFHGHRGGYTRRAPRAFHWP